MSGEKTEQPTAKKAPRRPQKRTSRKEPRDRLFGVNSGTHRRAVRLCRLLHVAHLCPTFAAKRARISSFQDALIDVAIAIAKEMAYLLAPIILVAALIAIFF